MNSIYMGSSAMIKDATSTHSIKTEYGMLNGLSVYETYPNGGLKSCILTKPTILATPYGDFVPQYEDDGVRRKFVRSLSFYESGRLKSISCHNRVLLKTPIGELPAELITFYENGSIKRLFPLNGKISGYWSEEDEYGLAESLKLNIPFEGKTFQLDKKIMSLCFYKSGALKSLTLWPNDHLNVETPIGLVKTRIGIAFHENGKLKSIEPADPVKLETPIGSLTAYDVNALGIHGEVNSLCFTEEGRLKSLTSSSEKIEIYSSRKLKATYKPLYKLSLLEESMVEIVPVQIVFDQNKVHFRHDNILKSTVIETDYFAKPSHFYDIHKFSFSISPYIKNTQGICSNCATCKGCQ